MTDSVVGREDELRIIEAFLDRAVDGPSVLVLEGEAGIGKSTLWSAGVGMARERAGRVLVSRPAETEQTLPDVVLGDLFGEVSPELLGALPVPRRRAFESALLLREPLEGPVDPRTLGVAIQTLLPLLAGDHGLVLCIDDDQWMDPSSAATLAFALRRLQDLPVRLLLSRRADDRPAAALEEAMVAADVERLRVNPFSLGAVQVLLRQRLGVEFSRPMLLRLHDASGGNPFYALELARVQPSEPARDLTEPLVVPPRLEHLVDVRVGAFDAATRQSLLLIAAHGRFPVEFVRNLEVPPEAIDKARAANVIETVQGFIRFTHPLLASAIYQGAADAARRDAHRQLATVLDDPVHRGRHVALAADQPDEKIAAALESAAIVARDRGMSIAAAELAASAHRLTPTIEDDHRHRRAVASLRAFAAAGDGVHAREMAADLIKATLPGPRRAELRALSAGLEGSGTAVPILLDALAEAAGEPGLEAAIHARLADEGRMVHGTAWAERHARAAVRLAELVDDDALRANAQASLALLRFDHQDPKALEMAEGAYRLAARVPDSWQVRDVGVTIGHLLMWMGESDRARLWLETELAAWRDRDEQVRAELLWYLALVEFGVGKWDLAEQLADQSREIVAQYEMELSQDHFLIAWIALHRGHLASAREQSRLGIALAEGQLVEGFFAVLAACDLWSGDPVAALVNFDRAEQAAVARGGKDPGMRQFRAEHVEALLQLGDVDTAVRLVAEWEGAAARLGRRQVLAHTLRCRGLIAAARGDLPKAIELLDAAVRGHAAAGDPFGQARALLALGVARRRSRQKRSAREALESALSAFKTLGAMSWVTAAEEELGRIGGRQRIEGLSPSELSVATLVAEGRTNREVASALFLGERTVASHLTRIYSKLAIRSRTELARMLRPSAGSSDEDPSKVQPS
jgi:DNA-binding NarL/FixJ family response regulator